MEELEKIAKTLIWAITEKTLKSLKDKGLLKEPSKLQMLCSSPEMKSLIKKLSSPKYDPNRLFCEGDEVRVIEKDGRTVHDPLNGGIWRVARNERTGGAHEMSVLVHLIYEDEKTALQIHVPFCFLELVTPVEELEPYSVGETTDYFSVDKDNEEVSLYWKARHPHAKEAAEAECKKLNEEYRKETK